MAVALPACQHRHHWPSWCALPFLQGEADKVRTVKGAEGSSESKYLQVGGWRTPVPKCFVALALQHACLPDALPAISVWSGRSKQP